MKESICPLAYLDRKRNSMIGTWLDKAQSRVSRISFNSKTFLKMSSLELLEPIFKVFLREEYNHNIQG